MCTFPSLDIVDQEAVLCLLRPRLAPLVMVMSLTSAAERTVAVAELVCTCLASAVCVSVDLVLAPVKISERRTVQIWRPHQRIIYTVYLLYMYEVSFVYVVYPVVSGAHLTATKDCLLCLHYQDDNHTYRSHNVPPAASIPCIYNISIA